MLLPTTQSTLHVGTNKEFHCNLFKISLIAWAMGGLTGQLNFANDRTNYPIEGLYLDNELSFVVSHQEETEDNILAAFSGQLYEDQLKLKWLFSLTRSGEIIEGNVTVYSDLTKAKERIVPEPNNLSILNWHLASNGFYQKANC